MKKKILSAYQKVARAATISIDKIVYPNQTLEGGIFEQVMSGLKQVPLMQHTIVKPIQNIDVDTSHLAETGTGAIYIPETKDYWLGNGVE